jgi:hypothetical protein
MGIIDMFHALAILTNEYGKTIGAEVLTPDGVKQFSTNDLKTYRESITMDNAIIDSNGFIRSKSGSLGKKLKQSHTSNMFYDRNSEIQLAHGSNTIVKKPLFGKGEKTNDYGQGFYTVSNKHIELAKEWACSPFNQTNVGYVNTYNFQTSGLTILNLDKQPIIDWIVLTAHFRRPNVDKKLLQQLEKRYLIDIRNYDCIYGWRCDDTYSSIITGFFNGDYSAEAIKEAIHLGHLQEQFVLISEKAFNNISFVKSLRVDNFTAYRNKFLDRKNKADLGLKQCRNKFRAGKYIDDFL